MLTYLEATRFKILNVMMDLEGKQRVNHPMAAYLDHTKDKASMSQSILRIPDWFTADSPPIPPLDWEDRGTADGRVETWSPGHSPADRSAGQSPSNRSLGHHSPANQSPGGQSPANHSPLLLTALGVSTDSSGPIFTTTNPILYNREADQILSRGRADGGGGQEEPDAILPSPDKEEFTPETPLPDSDFDEFDSNEEEEEEKSPNSQDNEIHEIYYQEKQVAVIGQCRAVYDYTANMYDELNIRYGDVINIHDKQEDGWWLGECGGKVGIFPATYVEPV